MSWLSSGLAKIGISKDLQRKVTKPVVAGAATLVAGPAAGAAVAKFLPVSSGPRAVPSPIVEPVASARPFVSRMMPVLRSSSMLNANRDRRMEPTASAAMVEPAPAAVRADPIAPQGAQAWKQWLPLIIIIIVALVLVMLSQRKG